MRSRLILPALLTLPMALPAQSVSVGASRWLTSPGISEYRLGMDGTSYGPFVFRPGVQLVRRGGESAASWAGVGSDAILRLIRDARPYLVGGLGLGLGKPDSLGGLGPALGVWGGVGAELFTLGPLGFQAEALYTWRARMDVKSVSLGIRAGMKLGGPAAGRLGGLGGRPDGQTASRPVSPVEQLPSVPRSNPADEDVIRRATGNPAPAPAPATAATSVVATALGAMGTPYRWGGSDENGFDCSGLIQYAFREHGIELPRRSVEQARAGYEVGRNLDALLPGDILTFSAESSRTDPVSHVGLYLGDGRFIHSATGGVQVSVLSPTDPAASWWLDRWVGARRVK